VLKVGDFPQPRIFVKEVAVTLRRKHTRVMRADGLESVGVLFSGEIAHCIAAAKREGISVRQLVPQFFQTECRFGPVLAPEKVSHFFECSNRHSIRPLTALLEQVSDAFFETRGIRHVLVRKSRKRSPRIQQCDAPVKNSALDIETLHL